MKYGVSLLMPCAGRDVSMASRAEHDFLRAGGAGTRVFCPRVVGPVSLLCVYVMEW